MAGFKETPRQKMIGMMYLVLTAMLALNVSVEILNAFVTVNESIEGTNEKFQAKVDETYAEFAQQYSMNKEKTQEYWTQAQEVQKLSNEIVEYIDSIKLVAISKSEGATIDEIRNVPLRELATKDKYDVVTNYFIGSTDLGKKGEAYTLSANLETYRTKLATFLGDDTQMKIAIPTNTDIDGNELRYENADGQGQSWEEHNFYHTILAADVTILNKIIAEVRGAEYDVVKYLFSKISKSDFKFSNIEAQVIPKSDYILLGDNYEAEVIVAAYDTIANLDVRYLQGTDSWNDSYLDRARSAEGIGGKGQIKVKTSSEGLKKYSGVVRMKDPITGVEVSYPFEHEYTVAKPSLTVSATKMNVFYMGVPNPVSISVPGVPSNRLRPSLSKGSLTSDGKGGWIATMPAGSEGKVDVNVSATVDGSNKFMGKAEYRVKRLPTPTATIAATDGGVITKSKLKAATAIIPTMPQDFEFEANFEITRFTMVTFQGGDVVPEQGRGNRLNPRMKSLIQNARRGQKIWFEDIFAKGPDGTTRRLNTIVLTVQ
jgi:gliding motility-associated protein GldM